MQSVIGKMIGRVEDVFTMMVLLSFYHSRLMAGVKRTEEEGREVCVLSG